MPQSVYRNIHPLMVLAANVERSLHGATRDPNRPITRTPVVSSMFTAVGHDGVDTIEIEFSPGRIYRGTMTPQDYQAFVSAKSLGQYFNQQLKGKIALTLVEQVADPADTETPF